MSIIEEVNLNLRYELGTASVYELETEIGEAIRELADSHSDLASAAAAHGIAPDAFAGASASVDQEGKGFAEVVVLIAIFAPAANHALRTLWDELVLPRVKSRLGVDAVGGEEGSDNESSDDDKDRD